GLAPRPPGGGSHRETPSERDRDSASPGAPGGRPACAVIQGIEKVVKGPDKARRSRVPASSPGCSLSCGRKCDSGRKRKCRGACGLLLLSGLGRFQQSLEVTPGVQGCEDGLAQVGEGDRLSLGGPAQEVQGLVGAAPGQGLPSGVIRAEPGRPARK